jgi:hypothetical protein
MKRAGAARGAKAATATLKLRPSRRGNFDVTTARLRELGIGFSGYDHHRGCYDDVVVPPGLEAALAADPLIDVVTEDDAAGGRRGAPVWSSRNGVIDPKRLAQRLKKLRSDAGWDLATAAARSGGALSAEAIGHIERTGECDVRELIALADLYTASLDHIAARTVVRGSRRR